MKSLICSILILCFIIILTVFVAFYTDKRLESFIALVNEEIPSDDCADAYIGALKVEKEYEGIKTHLILFMRENEVRDIEMHISDIKSAAKADDLSSLIAAKSRLTLHMQQLRRLSTFGIEAIF
jgi:hypothetical protein